MPIVTVWRAPVARSVVALLLFAMFLPTVSLGSVQSSTFKSLAPIASPQLLNAPPELYQMTGNNSVTGTFSLSSAAISGISKLASNLQFFQSIPSSLAFLVSPVSKAATKSTSVEPSRPGSSDPPSPPQVPRTVDFDFGSDQVSDIGRWQPSTTEFKVKDSSTGSYLTYTLGTSAAKAAPGDFNGDGAMDAAVFQAGTWTYKTSPSATAQTISLGTTGDIPAAGDYDGDGTTDAAVFRPSTGAWHIRRSSNGTIYSTTYGMSGDIPVPGNYDGDSYSDIAVFRPSNGTWYLSRSSAGDTSFTWGVSVDIPVMGDFDGDGKTDATVYRPSEGKWYVLRSYGGFTLSLSQYWGNYADQPVPADYDGDGKSDFAVWRPTTGVWHIIDSLDGSYRYLTLGVPGDTAIPSAYTKQIGAAVASDAMASVRLKPLNATGGTNLYSQNFAWQRTLVSLPGRSGLDAAFGLSYNSLVWAKSGSTMVFDPDNSNVSPGFKLGFPTIEPAHYDASKSTWRYLMVTPDGSRVEFRQVGLSNVYDAADSSYAQLVTTGAPSPNSPVEPVTIKVTSADGTQMSYEWRAGAFRCSKITDRNGNYITVAHGESGELVRVTDTLGRQINVYYDSEYYPISIQQTWKNNNGAAGNRNHTWATFEYASVPINTSFSGVTTVFGPGNGSNIKVLNKVIYADNSRTEFHYNGYGQVNKIDNLAADLNSLNYVEATFGSLVAPSDCPRLTRRKEWVRNFNGGAAVFTENEPPAADTFNLPSNLNGTSSSVKVFNADHPERLYTLIHYGSSGWSEGLPLATEDCLGIEQKQCSSRKRWSYTGWDQDQIGGTPLSYVRNPRPIEKRIGDEVSQKRTLIEYYKDSSYTGQWDNVALYGLVDKVKVMGSDLTTVRRQSYTQYDLRTAYTSRRILGLPSEVQISGRETGNLDLMSKVTYSYDDENFSQESNQIISPSGHDTANYGSSFIVGRGNMTLAMRHDVVPESSPVSSRTRYDIAGSPVAQIDALNRKVAINYTDSFNDNISRNSFAYPTTLTDPAGNSSTARYRYDMGANVRAQSPVPFGGTTTPNSQGKISEREYDLVGRLLRDKIVNNGGAYTRYEYPTNGVQNKVYRTVIDTNGGGADGADEVLNESWTDGAGRVLRTRTEHPTSVANNWTAQTFVYDMLGRLSKQSVPTEVSVSNPNDPNSWAIAGDDAVRGWLYTHQKYDWKDRIVRKINTDGADSQTLNASDQIFTYEGCGCAGQITTIEGENVTETDYQGNNPNELGRRKQKIYEDILGRTWKTETMNWNGSLYSTSIMEFNGRDQVLTATKTEASNSRSQVTAMTYDGHGRLKTQHRPEQSSGTNTLYNYNADDSISNVRDARGAITHYSYNTRGLVDQVSYSVPGGSTIPVTSTATFGYDSAGNRITMSDGLGSVAYEYNELSQLKSETRDFTDNLTEAPPNNFKLEYTYNLSGGLKSLKDPYGQQFNYAHDKVGRLTSVNGSTPFNGITNYANTAIYNARGTLTGLSYGNGTNMAVTSFNSKLQATGFEVKKGSTNIIKKQYQFLSDGSLKFVKDDIDARFDRLYKYDHAGRTITAEAGTAARGQPSTVGLNLDRPYTMQYTHDAFGHLTGVNGNYYNSVETNTYDYPNGRNPSWQYDAEGNQTSDEDAIYETDAAGRSVKTSRIDLDNPPVTLPPTISRFDGEGNLTKRTWDLGTTPASETSNYYVRSSVLKRVVTEVDPTGKKLKTFVTANGVTLAEQSVRHYFGTTETLTFIHQDASGVSVQQTLADGNVSSSDVRAGEYDALGRNIANSNPYIALNTELIQPEFGGSNLNLFGSGEGYRPGQNTYTVDGMPVSASYFLDIINSGLIGGAFGLLESTARMSVRDYSVRFNDGDRQYERSFGSVGEAGNFARRMGQNTVYRNILVKDSWSIASLISGGYERALTSPNQELLNRDERTRDILDSVASTALKLLETNKACRDAISSTRWDAVAALKTIMRRDIRGNSGLIDASERTNGKYVAWTYFPGATQGITRGSIDFYNMFFTGDYSVSMEGSAKSPTGAKLMLLTFLHEIGHLTGKWVHPEDLEGYEGSVPMVDKNWDRGKVNQLVYDKCIKVGTEASGRAK